MIRKYNPLYPKEANIYRSMKNRCCDKKNKYYHIYGGRGIKVCDRWMSSFDNFLEDMGPKPSDEYTIDRINNNGNYEPDNCRWATRKVQNNNRRDNKIIEYNGQSRTAAQWADLLGFTQKTIYTRIRKKWDIERLLTTPERKAKRKNVDGEVKRLLESGKRICEIVKELKCSYGTIYSKVQKIIKAA